MIIKISSKHQITIPKIIYDNFDLKKGDALEIAVEHNKIVMIPKEIFFEDKYSKEDLGAAEKALAKSLPHEEIAFESGTLLVNNLKKRMKD